jgi:PAS domain S-box-containing protein
VPVRDQEYLQRAARRYQALASSDGSIVWVVDPQLRPTGRNEAWEVYTGQREGEYFGSGWMSAVHASDRDRFQAQAAHALATGEPLTIEIDIRRADGIYRRNLIRAVPVTGDSGIVEWIGTATDIEEARQTADSLSAALAEQRDLRARLLALTEGTERLLGMLDPDQARAGVIDLARRVLPADGYAIWLLDTVKGEWSVVQSSGLPESFISERIVGEVVKFTNPLAVGDVMTDGSWNDRRDAYVAAGIRALMAVPLPIHGERRATLVIYHRAPHEPSDTELRVGIALGQLAAATLGNVESYVAQTRMRIDAERHATRMAYLADASALLGSLNYKQTLRKLAELTVPRMADWCAIDIVHPGGPVERLVTAHVDPAKVQMAMDLEARYPSDPNATSGVPNVLRTGQPEFYPEISEELLRASARSADHLAVLTSLGIHSALIVPLVARGRTLGAISFVSATAARPLSESDASFLAEVGRRASLAIDNARLFEEAEAANHAKDEFLAILSHELRTPLNAIMGWAHMLRDGLPEAMSRHAVEVISRNARSQKQLVEDLLDVARIASGKLDLHPSKIDLIEIARAAVDTALPAARQRNVTLSMTAEVDGAPLFADSHRLQQVVANLLSNALKFTDPGGSVTVSVVPSDRHVELVVGDTGGGISSEVLPHVFDRFRQGDPSLTRVHGGLGLGLWLVKQIVDAHGGTVTAHSAGTGEGSTFRVRLPQQPAEATRSSAEGGPRY